MRVLVTGGAGYVGFSLTRALLALDAVSSITVYDSLARRNYNTFFADHGTGDERLRFVEGDILDGETLERECADADVLVHLAAHVTAPDADIDWHHFDQINNWGSAQVARAAEKSESIGTLLYLSSAAVYGDSELPVNESTEPMPSSAYGVSKLRGESHFARFTDRSVHVVRSANVFGFNPLIRFDAVINRTVFNAKFHGRIVVHGTGEQTRPFVNVDRLAAGLTSLLRSDRAGLVNFADRNLSLDSIVEHLEALFPGLDVVHSDRTARMTRLEMDLPSPLHRLIGDPRPFNDEMAELADSLSV